MGDAFMKSVKFVMFLSSIDLFRLTETRHDDKHHVGGFDDSDSL